ncbi:MAG: hypothetical protein WC477_05790 [Patescibacteria group bacterium]
MKKYLFLIIFGCLFVFSPAFAASGSGACSWHGGVNCTASASYGGSVVCNDGWKDSSVSYKNVIECQTRSVFDPWKKCTLYLNLQTASNFTCSVDPQKQYQQYKDAIATVNQLTLEEQALITEAGEKAGASYDSLIVAAQKEKQQQLPLYYSTLQGFAGVGYAPTTDSLNQLQNQDSSAIQALKNAQQKAIYDAEQAKETAIKTDKENALQNMLDGYQISVQLCKQEQEIAAQRESKQLYKQCMDKADQEWQTWFVIQTLHTQAETLQTKNDTTSCSSYGVNSYLATDDKCYCKTGYQWNVTKTACITITIAPSVNVAASNSTPNNTISPIVALPPAVGAFDPLKKDNALIKRLTGSILLQVESRGEAWYLDPVTSKRFYMKDGAIAYEMMRSFGLGVSEADYERVNAGNTTLLNRLRGKIILRPQAHGEAYYIHPKDLAVYYLQNGDEAYRIMRLYSLGITNVDLEKIPTGILSF